MIDAPTPAFGLAHFYHLLLSKAWVIILFEVLSLIAAIAYLKWAPKIYESRAVIEVEQETPRVNNLHDFNAGNAEDVNLPETLKTIEQALMSQTLLLRVVKANRLDKDPSFTPPKKDGSTYMDSELVARFKLKVNAAIRHGTRLIDVIVEDIDLKVTGAKSERLSRQMRFFHLIALAVATAGIAWCCTGELVRSEDVSRPTRQVTHSAAPSRSAEMLFFGCSAALTVSTLVSRGSRRIGVGTQEASPLPPNRTSGFPAFGPPVGGLLSKVNKTKSPKHLLKHT